MTGVRVSAEARLRLSFTATRRLCLLCDRHSDRNVNCNYRTSKLKNAWSFTSTFPHVIRIAAHLINYFAAVILTSLARVSQSSASVNVSLEGVLQNGDIAPLIFNTGGYWS
jgi:hypothetical protein